MSKLFVIELTELQANGMSIVDEIRTGTPVIIHDPREVKKEIEPHLKRWNIITIRQRVQTWLADKFGIEPKFCPHPFYPYTTQQFAWKAGAVSISRIAFNKNVEWILEANELLDAQGAKPIKIYGEINRLYAYHVLGFDRLTRYHKGTFDRTFAAVANLLGGAKIVVDLTYFENDGGGTQYTFLEAIHAGCCLVLNRKWVEGADSQFKEGYNCLAVSNGKELAELMAKIDQIDTERIATNAQQLLLNHTGTDIKRAWQAVMP